MRIIHCSDTHGRLPVLPKDGEFVIHSGDYLPNASRGNLTIELPFQERWIRANAENLKEWLGGRSFLFSSGNHDFIDPCPIMVECGIDAINLNDKVTLYKGLNFYGFPYVPFIAGEWAGEKHLPEMHDEMNRMLRRIKDSEAKIDILVSHAPPFGVLDVYMNEHLGNTLMTNMMAYQEMDPLPRYYLCGHIHESHGSAELFGVTISNAATRVHSIDIQTGTG